MNASRPSLSAQQAISPSAQSVYAVATFAKRPSDATVLAARDPSTRFDFSPCFKMPGVSMSRTVLRPRYEPYARNARARTNRAPPKGRTGRFRPSMPSTAARHPCSPGAISMASHRHVASIPASSRKYAISASASASRTASPASAAFFLRIASSWRPDASGMLVERHKFLTLRLLIRFGGQDRQGSRTHWDPRRALPHRARWRPPRRMSNAAPYRSKTAGSRETRRSARLVQNRQVLGEHAKVVAKTLFVAFDLAIDALDILRKATAFALDIVVFDQIPLRLPVRCPCCPHALPKPRCAHSAANAPPRYPLPLCAKTRFRRRGLLAASECGRA